MDQLLGWLPQLVSIIEKGGPTGLLLIGLILLGKDYLRLRNLLVKVYGQRDKARLGFVKCKAACDAGGVKVDLSDVDDLLDEGEMP